MFGLESRSEGSGDTRATSLYRTPRTAMPALRFTDFSPDLFHDTQSSTPRTLFDASCGSAASEERSELMNERWAHDGWEERREWEDKESQKRRHRANTSASASALRSSRPDGRSDGNWRTHHDDHRDSPDHPTGRPKAGTSIGKPDRADASGETWRNRTSERSWSPAEHAAQGTQLSMTCTAQAAEGSTSAGPVDVRRRTARPAQPLYSPGSAIKRHHTPQERPALELSGRDSPPACSSRDEMRNARSKTAACAASAQHAAVSLQTHQQHQPPSLLRPPGTACNASKKAANESPVRETLASTSPPRRPDDVEDTPGLSSHPPQLPPRTLSPSVKTKPETSKPSPQRRDSWRDSGQDDTHEGQEHVASHADGTPASARASCSPEAGGRRGGAGTQVSARTAAGVYIPRHRRPQPCAQVQPSRDEPSCARTSMSSPLLEASLPPCTGRDALPSDLRVGVAVAACTYVVHGPHTSHSPPPHASHTPSLVEQQLAPLAPPQPLPPCSAAPSVVSMTVPSVRCDGPAAMVLSLASSVCINVDGAVNEAGDMAREVDKYDDFRQHGQQELQLQPSQPQSHEPTPPQTSPHLLPPSLDTPSLQSCTQAAVACDEGSVGAMDTMMKTCSSATEGTAHTSPRLSGDGEQSRKRKEDSIDSGADVEDKAATQGEDEWELLETAALPPPPARKTAAAPHTQVEPPSHARPTTASSTGRRRSTSPSSTGSPIHDYTAFASRERSKTRPVSVHQSHSPDRRQAGEDEAMAVGTEHILEVYDFASSTREYEIDVFLEPFKAAGYKLKWVDDTHALAVFPSNQLAKQALESISSPIFKLRPFSHATNASKTAVTHEDLTVERPHTSSVVARRLIASVLHVKCPPVPQSQAAVLREARRARRDAAQRDGKGKADDAWSSPDDDTTAS